MERGIFEGASKKNLVVFLFGDVLGHSFFSLQCFCYNYTKAWHSYILFKYDNIDTERSKVQEYM